MSIDIHEHLDYLPDQRCFVANKIAPCCLVERNFALHRLAGETTTIPLTNTTVVLARHFSPPPNGQTAIIAAVDTIGVYRPTLLQAAQSSQQPQPS